MYDGGERFIAEVVTYRKVSDIITFKLPSREGREGGSWIFGEVIFIKQVAGVAGHTLSIEWYAREHMGMHKQHARLPDPCGCVKLTPRIASAAFSG
jgi:hypothetical protein